MEKGGEAAMPTAVAGTHVDSDGDAMPVPLGSGRRSGWGGGSGWDEANQFSAVWEGALGSPLYLSPPTQIPCSPLKKTNLPSCLS